MPDPQTFNPPIPTVLQTDISNTDSNKKKTRAEPSPMTDFHITNNNTNHGKKIQQNQRTNPTDSSIFQQLNKREKTNN